MCLAVLLHCHAFSFYRTLVLHTVLYIRGKQYYSTFAVRWGKGQRSDVPKVISHITRTEMCPCAFQMPTFSHCFPTVHLTHCTILLHCSIVMSEVKCETPIAYSEKKQQQNNKQTPRYFVFRDIFKELLSVLLRLLLGSFFGVSEFVRLVKRGIFFFLHNTLLR